MLARASDLPGIALLDSGGPAWGRTSILGVGGETAVSWPDRDGDPFATLRNVLDGTTAPRHPRWPFTGGLIGWFGYDVRLLLEVLPDRHPRWCGLPDLHLATYRVCALRDEASGQTEISVLEDGDDPDATDRARELAAVLRQRLTDPARRPGPAPQASADGRMDAPPVARHVEAVRRARHHIARGDVYQVNLAQRLVSKRPADLIGFYRRLRADNPSAFGAYVPLGDEALLSVSPERFLSVDGDHVVTCPIKGTAPRDKDPALDDAHARRLLSSEKDRAELAMIVDVMRNDLSRVCDPGSVTVRRPLVLESHPTVHHLVSEIEGRLEEGRDRVDLLRAALPGGSVTGAPRIRAMEIIDELEACRRSVYCGSLGYMGYDGRMELNILIRTAVATRDQLAVFGGGGIVADSDPEDEHAETLHKVLGFIRALGCEEESGLG
jgi:para-aminobenzoate synthetase component 1